MMLGASQNYDKPLSEDRLFGWHAALFPTGRSGMSRTRVAARRGDCGGPMQVVSGPIGQTEGAFRGASATIQIKKLSNRQSWVPNA